MTLDEDALIVLTKTGGQEACYPGCGGGMGSCHDNVNGPARRLALSRLGLARYPHVDRAATKFTDGTRRLECKVCHQVWLYHPDGTVWE